MLSGAQQATAEDAAAEPAVSKDSSSKKGRRKKPAGSAPRAAGKAKKTAKASAASAKLSRSSSGASPRRRGSSFIDTTSAQDIRAFLPPPPPPPSHQPQTQPQDVSASVVAAVAASSARPESSWTAVSALSSSLWSTSAEVDIAALRERFNLGKPAKDDSTAAVSEMKTATKSTAQGGETDSQPAASRKGRIGDKAAKPLRRQSAATRSRTRRAQQQTAVTQADIPVDSGVVMSDIVADQPAAALTIGPSSLLPLSSPSAAGSELVGEAASTEAVGDEQVQPLERAKTVVAVNNTAELETRETLPQPAAGFLLSSAPASCFPDPRTPQQQTEAERAAQRQMSLASNSSSSSTASILSSRLHSPELLPSLPPPFACESLPCSFRDYAVKHLHCPLSPSLSLSCCAVTTAGNVRALNQDAFALSSMQAEGGGGAQVAVLGVFDGHGSLGDNAARLCAEFMPDRLTSLLSSRQSSAASCLRQTFDATQQLLLRIARAEQSVTASTVRKCSPQLEVVANPICVSVHAPAAISPPHPPSPSPPLPPSPSPPPPPAGHDALHVDLAPPGLLRGVGFEHGEVMQDAKEDRSPQHADLMESKMEEKEEQTPLSAAEAQQSETAAGGALQQKKKRRRKTRLFKPRKRATPSPPAASSHTALAPPAAVQPAVHDSGLPTIAEGGLPSPLNGSSGVLQPIKRSPIKNVPGRDGGGGRADGWQAKQRAAALPSAGLSAFSTVLPAAFPPSPSARPAAHRPPAVAAVDLDYGTTGLLVVVDGSELVIANCGDSRCIVFDQQRQVRDEQGSSTPTAHTVRAVSPLPPSSRPRQLSLSRASRSFSSPFSSYSSPASLRWQQRFITADHDPSLPTVTSQAEVRRVLASHGALQQLPGQQRVYPACLSFSEARSRALTLNMSRALGHNILSQHGVSHQPDVDTVSLPPLPAASSAEQAAEQAGRDVWLVLGSDGLWDVMTVEDVLQVIDGQLEEQSRRRRQCRGGGGGGVAGQTGCSLCLECVCCQLLSKAEESWMQYDHGDNISVVLARITRR